MSESSMGVCAVKLNLALACPSLLFSFFDKVDIYKKKLVEYYTIKATRFLIH